MEKEMHPDVEVSENTCEIMVSNPSAGKFKTILEFMRSEASKLGEDQAFYTLDLADVLYKVKLWKLKMMNMRTFYAVKTNSDPVLLRLLVLMGFSFDCASPGEIRMVLQCGGNPKNIIFAHTIKTPSGLRYACSVGVELMTFDSEQELMKIHNHYPDATLLLRLAPEEVSCSFDISDKFGCSTQDATGLLTIAKNLDLKVVGVSFHVGGLCQNPDSYKATIQASKKVFDDAKQLGFKFTTLDIGGGFSGAKGTEPLFDQSTTAIKRALQEYFPGRDIEIVAEVGCFFVCSASTLTTAISGKKEKKSQSIQRYYYLNNGVYGSFFQGYQNYGIKPKPLLDEAEVCRRPVLASRLWGNTSSGVDLIADQCHLADMEEGEFLVWENTGAYSRAICSTFCGMPLPATKHVFVNDARFNLEIFKGDVLDFIRKECSFIDHQ